MCVVRILCSFPGHPPPQIGMAPNSLIAHWISDEVLYASANTVCGVICVRYSGRVVQDNFRQAFCNARPAGYLDNYKTRRVYFLHHMTWEDRVSYLAYKLSRVTGLK